MNILLINHYAGSIEYGMEYRPYYMAKEWAKLGHQVTIVASSFSHVRSKQPAVGSQLQEEMVDGIRYMWIKTHGYDGNGAKRALNMFSFVAKLLRFSGKIARKVQPDLVIASSTYPLDIVPAAMISSRSKAKLIFEVHDLWPLSPIELGNMSRRHPFIMVMQWAENFAYAKSDHVVSLLPKADAHMIEHGMSPRKFRYVPNGIDTMEWQENVMKIPDEHRSLLMKLKERGEFLIGYAGTHGLANSLSSLLEAAKLTKGMKISCVLIGKGPDKKRLMQEAKENGLDNVYFLPPVPKSSIPNLLGYMDALYIGLKSEPLFRFGISPNKLIDYMMAAKPVVQSIEAGNDMVAECGCGYSVPPENPKAIADAIVRLANMNYAEREEMGSRGRSFIIQNHDYKVLAQNFLDVLANEPSKGGPNHVRSVDPNSAAYRYPPNIQDT